MDKPAFPSMHYALIAAGEGSRLKEEGVQAPKPLVSIQGQPMIERLISIFLRNGAKSISVICNEQMTEVREFLESLQGSDLLKTVDAEGNLHVCPLNIVVQTTPSSMHSFAALSQVIPEGRFCLTTVDTIFKEEDFSSFIQTFVSMDESQGDGLFAVTTFVDDEKPLWVGIEPQQNFPCACAHEKLLGGDAQSGRIVGFYDREDQIPAEAQKTVSGGIYCLDTRTAFPILQNCLAKGQSRMRNYQRALVEAGLRLKGYVFPQIMDIDHASDIEKAERWLSGTNRNLLAISRDASYSPNNESKDAAIWNAVLNNLRQRGWKIDECSETVWLETKVEDVQKRYQKIIHMSRRMRSLMRLERVRIPVLNSANAVRTVAKSRELTLMLLQQAGISVPEWWAYGPEEDEMFVCEPHLQQLLPGWVKAMREEGARPEDVCFVSSPLEADTCILQLASEQIPDIVVTKHEDGDLVKCYVVLSLCDEPSLRLFRWFYPQESGYSKFGTAETHNTSLQHHCFDEQQLSALAKKIGQTLRLQFFGFDAIVRPDGSLVVIDVNDWPSFSSCREEAAEAIALVIDNN